MSVGDVADWPMTSDSALRRYFRTWGLRDIVRTVVKCAAATSSRLAYRQRPAQQFRQLGDVGGDAPVPWEDILRPLLRELTAVPRTGRSIPLVGIMTDTHITSSRR
jgi:hypothetical protein